jgi:hypothetical protein
VVDAVAERHRYGGGLVDAFQASFEEAVARGVWDGAGKRRHDLNSLTKFIAQIYESTWIPQARMAYTAAREHFAFQLTAARNANPQRVPMLEQRLAIIEAQIRVFDREWSISPEAAKNVWRFAAAEKWT